MEAEVVMFLSKETRIKMRHIKSCRSGEIICDKGGNKALVHGRLGPLIFRSDFYMFTIAHYRPMTWMEAEKEGWKILTKDGKEPIPKKEIERLLGNVKITK